MRRVLQSNSDFMNNDLILVVTLCPHGNLKVIVKMNFVEFKVIRYRTRELSSPYS